MFILNNKEISHLTTFLNSKAFLSSEEIVEKLSIPGAGNMNYVLRVKTNKRSFIIKQARNYVEKYPQIVAPISRVLVEAAYYKKVKRNNNLQQLMPNLLLLDEENSILILEDLGDGKDFSFLYDSDKKLTVLEIKELIFYLSELHSQFKNKNSEAIFQNLEMRKLNYEHIFIYPFLEDNGFNLDTIQHGLQEIALKFKTDSKLKSRVEAVGKHYLENGNELLHGDFYPGSWLKTKNGIKIIDPEFSFYGSLEYDLGVFIAHLHLSQHNKEIIKYAYDTYIGYRKLDTTLLENYIGVEIMRRLIGLAQLPISKRSLKSKENLLNFSYNLLLK